MSEVIIHHNGAYNIYSSISDSPFFESGLSLEQLTAYTEDEYGRVGLERLPQSLERAHAKGSSGLSSRTLHDVIAANSERLTDKQFIEKYLTIRNDDVAIFDQRTEAS